MRNICLVLRYDGTAYHGWQIQKHLPTVCQTIQEALTRLCKTPVTLTGCGRTDAGVHALRYVANFMTESRIPVERFPYAVNTYLPEDISIVDAIEVPLDFHATYSCIQKEYTYRLYTVPHRDPLLARRSLFYPYEVDLPKFQETAAAFVGTHDFAAVRTMGSNVKTTVRTVYYFKVQEDSWNHYSFRVAADGFLYNMVRAMVGTVLYAQSGKMDTIDALLQSGNRSGAGPTLPPHGLYMSGIWYNDFSATEGGDDLAESQKALQAYRQGD